MKVLEAFNQQKALHSALSQLDSVDINKYLVTPHYHYKNLAATVHDNENDIMFFIEGGNLKLYSTTTDSQEIIKEAEDYLAEYLKKEIEL